jgi:hypothetical protein
MPSASSFNCAPDAISTPSVCWVQSSPDWRAGHGDAPVGPTMKGSPRPRFASDTATGAPGRVRFAYVKALANTAGA